MPATLERMAKNKPGPKPAASAQDKPKATTSTVRIREDIADMIQVICIMRGIDSADLLDQLIREEVTSIYKTVILERAKQISD